MPCPLEIGAQTAALCYAEMGVLPVSCEDY